MNEQSLNTRSIKYHFEAGFLLLISIAVFVFSVSNLFGPLGIVLALVLIYFTIKKLQNPAPLLALKVYQAKKLSPWETPGLYNRLEQMSRRLSLVTPHLHLIPSEKPIAFSTGSQKSPHIALSSGLLRTMTPSETTAIMAHELGHIKNGDLLFNGLMQALKSFLGNILGPLVFLALLTLPLPLFGIQTIDFEALFATYGSLIFLSLFQLKISRTREYLADLTAMKAFPIPSALSSALWKLRGPRIPEWLSTHPAIEKRVYRLLNPNQIGERTMTFWSLFFQNSKSIQNFF